MFDFDAGKFLIVGVIALIFIPPKDLPRVLRQVGQFVGKMRRMAAEFQGQFMDAMREADVADIRREAHKLAESVRIDAGFDSVADLTRHRDAEPATSGDAASEGPQPSGNTTAAIPAPRDPHAAAARPTGDTVAEAERLADEARGEAKPAARHSA